MTIDEGRSLQELLRHGFAFESQPCAFHQGQTVETLKNGKPDATILVHCSLLDQFAQASGRPDIHCPRLLLVRRGFGCPFVMAKRLLACYL